MSSDPFSDVLALVKAQSVISGGLITGGAWAIRFDPPRKIKFFTIVRGTCALALDGRRSAIQLAAGDVVLLTAPRGYTLGTDLARKPRSATQLFANRDGQILQHGTGDDFFLLGGHVSLDAASRDLLLDALPPLIHVPASAAEAAPLRWLLEQLVRERLDGRPGALLATDQLAQLMFVQILRVHLASVAQGAASPALGIGWLRALGDDALAPAMRLMHSDPSRAWSLADLAKASAMSRSTFALRFKSLAGVPPLAYLTAWRIRLASQSLRDTDTSVAALARSLGYASESAFSAAFKRLTGTAPAHYRSAARAQA